MMTEKERSRLIDLLTELINKQRNVTNMALRHPESEQSRFTIVAIAERNGARDDVVEFVNSIT